MVNSDLHQMLRLYHEAAQGIDGVFPLVGVAADTGHVTVHQFAVGNVDAMASEARMLAATRNIYMPPAILRGDLEPGRRGTMADIIAVVGLVIDHDADTGRGCRMPNGCDPSCVVITSNIPEVNQHIHYVLAQPMFTVEAAPLAHLLHRKCGGDAGTRDICHVWRLPGTLNHPSETKIKRGRPAVPQDVRLAGGSFKRIDASKLRAILEDMPDYVSSAARVRTAIERQRLVESLPGQL